jgi:shikimate kinase
MRIYLIGMMGSGKSTVGKKLANKLNYDFYDLDDLIESKIGMTIANFFEKEGEEKFRLLEQETLRETFSFENAIIATGGGAPCFFDNMAEINKNGVSCYLQAEVGVLLSRLKGAIDQRPLIKSLGSEQKIREYLENLLDKRASFYRQANKIVPAIDVSAEKLMEALEIPS